MTITFPITVSAQDLGDEALKAYAEDKISRVGRFAPRPIVQARVRLTEQRNPAIERSAIAQATLSLAGGLVRAQVSATTMREAVDELELRLRRQLEAVSERDGARQEGARFGTAGEWRHGALPTPRKNVFPRPVEERELLELKTLAISPLLPDEAAAEMQQLDYDFYLFTNADTGEENVVYRRDDGTLGLLEVTPGAANATGHAVLAESETVPASRTDRDAAVQRLNVTDEPFVFFVDERSGRGTVLYRRYDGHYGLLEPSR